MHNTDRSYADMVLSAAFPRSMEGVLPVDGGVVVAKYVTKKDAQPIVIVDGTFTREHYKQAAEEARAAGLSLERMYVYAKMATYLGAGIAFTKLSEIADAY